jgi:hypothetical protein
MLKIICILILVSFHISGQQKTPYFLSLESGVGYSRYLSTISTEGLNKNGIAITTALIWHPEHLLEAGIQTGFSVLYNYEKDVFSDEFGLTGAKTKLTAIPVQLLFRMRIFEQLRLHAGSGILLLFSSGEIFDDKFSTSQISINDFLGVSYRHRINNNLTLGGAFHYNYIFKLEESFISFQLTIAYKFLEW